MIFQLLEKLQNTENPEDQIKIADEILEKVPELYAYITKGCAHLELGQYDEAIETFDEAIKYDPQRIATPQALMVKEFVMQVKKIMLKH